MIILPSIDDPILQVGRKKAELLIQYIEKIREEE
jgi:hypothetical protein